MIYNPNKTNFLLKGKKNANNDDNEFSDQTNSFLNDFSSTKK